MTITSAPELSVALRDLALSHPREMAVAFRADYLAETVLHPLDSEISSEPELLAFNQALDGQMESEARAQLALRRLGRLVALAAKTESTETLADVLGVADADDLDSLLEVANWA